MSLETAQKIIDWIMELTPREDKLSIGFFGGEPLLRFDLIQVLTKYIREKECETGKVATLNVTTNGILLTNSILSFFREEKINLCVSLDGAREVHNRYRCHKDGRGSFDEVVANLAQALNKLAQVQVNAVFTPETICSLSESVRFIAQLGVPTIHLNPDITAKWTPQTFDQFQKHYEQVASFYIDCYQQNHELAINLIDSKIIVFLKGGYTAIDRCRMGEAEWGFAPSGNIYPCERLIGEDTGVHCLGNIHTGINSRKQCQIVSMRGSRNKECQSCTLQPYCMNWCGCTNYHMTGYPDNTSKMMCASEKAAITAASSALNSLKENDLFINH